MGVHQVVQSILPGDVVFDVGAHVGDKTDCYVKRGARVVCVEPQPDMVRRLQSRFQGNDRVTVVGKALGSAPGVLPMAICSQEPVISTLAAHWQQGRFAGKTWDHTVNVEVVRLDALVEEFGTPRYCKIDVEGFELEVLRGLSRRVGVISFEFAAEFIAHALGCIERLSGLGYRHFNVSEGESDDCYFTWWVTAQEMSAGLATAAASHPGVWGDIYAN